MNMDRILLIRTGGLGDCLLLWPALRALRRRFPLSNIELMGIKQRLEPMVVPAGANHASDIEGSGYHHLLLPDANIPTRVAERFGAFDTVIAFSAKGDLALGENLSECGVDEVHVFLPFPPPGSGIHVARYTIDLLASADLVDSESMLNGAQDLLPLADSEIRDGKKILRDLGINSDKLIVVAPGSGSEKKNWHTRGFVDVIESFSTGLFQVLLIEGPADVAAVEEIKKSMPNLPVLRQLTPSELEGVMAQCRLFLGNDSGPSHLAGLLGLASVVVFKASEPETWRPLGRVKVLAPRSMGQDVESSDVVDACHHLLDS